MGIRPIQNVNFTSGTLFRNEETEVVFVSLFNQDPGTAHTVTTSVLDWQNTCDPQSYELFAYLWGHPAAPPPPRRGSQHGSAPPRP
jgi:hypothetical protein